MKKLICFLPLLALGCGGIPGSPVPQKRMPVISIMPATDFSSGIFNVYRGPTCPNLAKIGSTPFPTFADAQAPSGPNCYGAKAQVNGIESDLSNTVTVTVP